MKAIIACLLVASLPCAASVAAERETLVERLEAKWSGVMRRIKGWDDEALHQFRTGYRSYPDAVLRRALEADTFDVMRAVLDAHAATQAQASKVRSPDSGAGGNAGGGPAEEAIRLAGKVLGEDGRDLVFIPITPCTVWDTRFASGPPFAGLIGDGVTRRFYSHLDGAGGSYAAYGGNPSCPETSQNALGGRPYAVMMTVYVNDPVGNGWLTFYRDGDPDPSQATISVYYSPGPTRTQAVVSKSSRGYGSGSYDIAVTGRYGSAHASASITGYFIKNQSTALECTTAEVAGTGTIAHGGAVTIAARPACPAGYGRVSVNCVALVGGRNTPLESNSHLYDACRWTNLSGTTVSGSDFLSQSNCCRIPGR